MVNVLSFEQLAASIAERFVDNCWNYLQIDIEIDRSGEGARQQACADILNEKYHVLKATCSHIEKNCERCTMSFGCVPLEPINEKLFCSSISRPVLTHIDPH